MVGFANSLELSTKGALGMLLRLSATSLSNMDTKMTSFDTKMTRVENVLVNFGQGLVDVKGAVQENTSEIQALRKDVAALKVSEYRKTPVMEKALPLLPLLLDSMYGINGWISVSHVNVVGEPVKLVVLSVRVTHYLMMSIDPTIDREDLMAFLTGYFKRYNYPHNMPVVEFKEILRKTDFKEYAVFTKSLSVMKKNKLNFIIMEQEYFKGLLAGIRKEFPMHHRNCRWKLPRTGPSSLP